MLPIIKPLSDAERSHLGQAWAKRAQTEYLMGLRFDALTQALRVHGTIPTVLQLCERAVGDAVKHSKLCAKVAKEFGIDASVDQVMRPGPLAPASLLVEQKVLYEVVAVACVAQTYQGALLGRMYQGSKWPSVRLTANIMLEDKIWQGRLGWAHLGAAVKRIDISWLDPLLLPMIQRAFEMAMSEAVPESFSRDDYGLFSTATCKTIMREALSTVVLPGFESFELAIDPARKWVNAQ